MHLTRCPDCGHVHAARPVETEPAAAAMVRQIREWCRENGVSISADNSVSESYAAAIVGVSKSTLRRWRREHRPLDCFGEGERVRYPLAILAVHLVQQQEG